MMTDRGGIFWGGGIYWCGGAHYSLRYIKINKMRTTK